MMPDSITNVVAALAARNAKEVNFQCGTITTHHMGCAEAFAESEKYRVVPFAADAKVVYGLASNCAGIANTITNRVKPTP